MGLYIRMAFYAFFPLGAAYGFGAWDEAAGTFTITINADQLAEWLGAYLAAYGATFGLSRVAKANGGAT